LSGGVVTRGVLLDVPASQSREHLDAGEGIGGAELTAAERAAGVSLLPGDAIFIRSGLDLRLRRAGGDPDSEPREGFLAEALVWLHERQVGALCADCIERLPSGYRRLPMPLHQIGLAAMGLVMVDGCDLERLAEACRQRNRVTFLVAVAPLPIRGGTGSPANPLVVF
jgi:kynurenine formamidase